MSCSIFIVCVTYQDTWNVTREGSIKEIQTHLQNRAVPCPIKDLNPLVDTLSEYEMLLDKVYRPEGVNKTTRFSFACKNTYESIKQFLPADSMGGIIHHKLISKDSVRRSPTVRTYQSSPSIRGKASELQPMPLLAFRGSLTNFSRVSPRRTKIPHQLSSVKSCQQWVEYPSLGRCKDQVDTQLLTEKSIVGGGHINLLLRLYATYHTVVQSATERSRKDRKSVV